MADNTRTTGFVSRIKGSELRPSASLNKFGGGGAMFAYSGMIYSNQSASGIGITNTTNEVTLDTYSLPANSLDFVGRGVKITAFGSFGNTTHSKTASVYFGSEKFLTNTTATTSWVIEVNVLKDAANSQAMGGVMFGPASVATQYQSGAETDTSAITIKVTGQTQTAATGDVVLNGWSIVGLD